MARREAPAAGGSQSFCALQHSGWAARAVNCRPQTTPPKDARGPIRSNGASAVEGPNDPAAPQATASVLADWIGPAAQGLQNTCDTANEDALDALRHGSYDRQLGSHALSYRLVLAAALLRWVSPDEPTSCDHPPSLTQPGPLTGWLSATPVAVIANVGADPAGLTTAQNLAVDSDGSLWVADQDAQDVRHYSPTGALLGTIGQGGTGPGQFTTPVGVAVDNSGHVYVSDFDADQILRFSTDGTYQTAWGAAGTAAGQTQHPAGIAWDQASGALIVADAGNHRLQAFDFDGQPAWSTTATPGDPAYLTRPRGVTVGPDGTIAVAEADTNAPRIVLFSAAGQYLGQTSANLPFTQPYDVAHDPSGNLWVADRGGELFELNGLGAVAKTLTAFGPDAETATPSALGFGTGEVWILDYGDQKISAFSTAALTSAQ